MNDQQMSIDRRRLLKSLAAGGGLLALNSLLPAYASALGKLTPPAARVPAPVTMDIAIERKKLDIAGRQAMGLTLNNTIPGPVVELYEGQ